jgi:GT2 family glycosyltransferase
LNLKKTLQAPMRRRQVRKYEERINSQTVAYHDWIIKKEKQEREANFPEETSPEGRTLQGQALSMEYIAYSGCGEHFSLKDVEADLAVFYGDGGKPDKEEMERMADYFARRPQVLIAYSDEDEIDTVSGEPRRKNPWLKPDWSPDTLLSYFYFGNLFAVRTKACREIPWLGSRDFRKNLYDFCLKAVELGGKAGHADSVLFHNTSPICPFGMEEKYEDIKKAAYIRRGWPLRPEGMVSIVIPSKDNPGVLSTCIHSILEASTYRNFEIIVIDNGSSIKNKERIHLMLSQMQEECRFRYIYEPMEFNFSAMCNKGAALAKGDYILLLNDDIEIIQEDWLDKMLEKAMLPHVGAVGVKLLYPGSHTIQHAGITNIRLGPAHKLQFRDDRTDYYFLRNRLSFDVLGVTGACLMVKKNVYEAAGGLSESLRVAFNDVEFCYHLYEMGFVNVVRNDVALYHHESLSRGMDDSVEKLKRLHQELDMLYEMHPSLYAQDPFYHRYLVRDVLDQEFYAGNRYEYTDRCDTVEPEALRDGLQPEWSNEVLRMGIEFAGDLCKWETGKSGGGNYFIQGWCYALQVDNSQYRFHVLLKPVGRDDGPVKDTEDGESAVWKLPVNRQYRPDIQENLGHLQMVALTGVCLQFDREALPEGEYLIGFLWEDCCSRQKLYQWTAETMVIVP